MKVGLTGGGGFIGSHLYQALIKDSRVVWCEKFDREKYNLLDSKSMEAFVKDKDIIFHLAGANRGSNQELLKINTIGTLNLLEAIRKYGTKNIKLIFASSFQVYKSTPDPVLIDETTPSFPESIYGLSKKFAEELIDCYTRSYGIRGIIYRISNVYGPRCKPYYNSVISTFIDLTLEGKALTIYGDGKQARSFIYIKDVVAAFLKAIDHQVRGISIFNICSGNLVSLNQIVREIERIINWNIKIYYGKAQEPKKFILGDAAKAHRKLGFKTKVPLTQGLKETISWFRRKESERSKNI